MLPHSHPVIPRLAQEHFLFLFEEIALFVDLPVDYLVLGCSEFMAEIDVFGELASFVVFDS